MSNTIMLREIKIHAQHDGRMCDLNFRAAQRVKLSCWSSKKLHGLSFFQSVTLEEWEIFKNNFQFRVKRFFSLAQLLQNHLSSPLPVSASILGRENHGSEGVLRLFLWIIPLPWLHPWPFPNHLLVLTTQKFERKC